MRSLETKGRFIPTQAWNDFVTELFGDAKDWIVINQTTTVI